MEKSRLSDGEVLAELDLVRSRYRRALLAAARAYRALAPDARRFDGRDDLDAAAFGCAQARAEARRGDLEEAARKERAQQLANLRERAGEWAELVPAW